MRQQQTRTWPNNSHPTSAALDWLPGYPLSNNGPLLGLFCEAKLTEATHRSSGLLSLYAWPPLIFMYICNYSLPWHTG
jgi:hypothetical protein